MTNKLRKDATVVVTGVGAIIGQGIVRSLRQYTRSVRVIGIDRNPHSMGSHLCDVFYAKPVCEESSLNYLSFWEETLHREKVDLVLPGLEVDLFFLNAHRQSLSATGARLGLNKPELIELARDKWLLGLELPKAGLASISTILSQTWDNCVEKLGSPPFLLKPRQGNGSRGIVRLNNETDLRYWANKSDENFMIQKIIGNDDEEYTVGTFGFGDGNSIPPIIFRRRLSPAGNTQYAEVVEEPTIELATQKLSKYFKPIGPTNYQFRKEKGMPYLLEINPRLSSSSSLRAGFGYNEAGMSLEYYLDGIRPKMPEVTKGCAWRYSEDFFQK
ncbi:MAG: ATP-grasp domain-containing protein [Gammaproteobacteria bacterium]|nr:ATP-grasp domain-containing protein [Gammaproteobacteria bacterium]